METQIKLPCVKTNLDIFWLKDESLEDTDNLPPPDVLAQEIVEQLQSALDEFRSVEEILARASVYKFT